VNQSVYRTKLSELLILIWNLNSFGFERFPVEPVRYIGTGPRQFSLSGREENPGDLHPFNSQLSLSMAELTPHPPNQLRLALQFSIQQQRKQATCFVFWPLHAA
jgi:hypothetical protein